MKKIPLLLLTILCIQLQAQVFSNGDTAYHTRISDAGIVYRQAGYSVVTPPNLDRTKKYSLWLAIPGKDERGNGSLEALRVALLGYDYDGAGPRTREPATVHPDMLTAVKAGKCIVACINYSSECNPIDINSVLDEVEKNYPVNTEREALIGFSLGGGAVMRYITSTQANADRVAFAVAAAPVSWATNWNYPKITRLPVWGVTNQTDPIVPPSNVKNMMANFNALNPDPLGRLIIFGGNGHGGIKEIEALNYAPQNIYDYLNSITRSNPSIYPTGTNSPGDETQSSTPLLKYTAPVITSVATFELKACDSSKYYDQDKFKWCVWSVPKGANVWYPFVTSGAGFCNAKVTLTAEGAYGFWVQACKGLTCVRDTFYVTYQKSSIPVPRNPVSYDGNTGMLLFTDSTMEKAVATVNFSTKKVTVKTEAGKEYTW